jgi:protein MpaA
VRVTTRAKHDGLKVGASVCAVLGNALEGWQPLEYGRSLDGVSLRAFLPDGDRPVGGLLTAAFHGEEALTALLIRRLLEQVPAQETTWVVAPVVNPDGLLAGTRQNARGVDLNRNFPASTWRSELSITYPPGIDPRQREPGNRTNRSSPGSEPASEPETRALLELVERLQPPLVIDVHSPLNLLLVRRGVPAGVAELLSGRAALPVVSELPGCPGAFDDWLEESGIPAVVYEIADESLPAACANHLPGLTALLRGAAIRPS